MNSIRSITQLLFSALVLTLAGGCSATLPQVSVQQTPIAAGQILPHRAILVLNKELEDYKHTVNYQLETDRFPLGSALQVYARNVAGKSFQETDVVSSEEQGASLKSSDLILIPRAVKSNTSLPGYGFGGGIMTMTLVVEWTIKNRASQDTIWLKTITATASEEIGGGNAFTAASNTAKHRGILFQKVFDDLSLQTCKAFQEAHELK